MGQVLRFTLIPAGATILGGVGAAFFRPGAHLRSIVQHLAAGVVFAAAATELLPDIISRHQPLEVAIGFGLGLGVMLLVRWLGRRLEGDEAGEASGVRVGMLATIGVDVLVDGVLIGIAFVAGSEAGVILTAALTLEVLFLGLSAAAALGGAGASRRKVIVTTAQLALPLPVGAAAGAAMASAVSPEVMEILLAAGLVALLYLVTEELLTEAHEEPETPFTTAAFFVGFLVLLLLRMITDGPSLGGPP